MLAIFLKPLILLALRARKIKGFRKMVRGLVNANLEDDGCVKSCLNLFSDFFSHLRRSPEKNISIF